MPGFVFINQSIREFRLAARRLASHYWVVTVCRTPFCLQLLVNDNLQGTVSCQAVGELQFAKLCFASSYWGNRLCSSRHMWSSDVTKRRRTPIFPSARQQCRGLPPPPEHTSKPRNPKPQIEKETLQAPPIRTCRRKSSNRSPARGCGASYISPVILHITSECMHAGLLPSLSLSPSLPLSLSASLPLSLSPSLPLSLPPSLPPSLPRFFAPSLPLSLPVSLSFFRQGYGAGGKSPYTARVSAPDCCGARKLHYIPVSLSLSLSLSLSTHTHIHTCIHMHTHAYTCIHMHTHAYTCIHA